MHDGYQDGVVAQRRLKFCGIQQAVGLGIEVGDFVTFTLELAATVEHRLVFGLQGDNVPALFFVEMCNTLDGEVVGLGGTRGPDYLAGICIYQRRHLPARLGHGIVCLPAKLV